MLFFNAVDIELHLNESSHCWICIYMCVKLCIGYTILYPSAFIEFWLKYLLYYYIPWCNDISITKSRDMIEYCYIKPAALSTNVFEQTKCNINTSGLVSLEWKRGGDAIKHTSFIWAEKIYALFIIFSPSVLFLLYYIINNCLFFIRILRRAFELICLLFTRLFFYTQETMTKTNRKTE